MTATHSHHHHDHGGAHAQPSENRRRLLLAMSLTAGFMVVETAGGLIAHSLALLADAGHMFADAGSLLLAWLAVGAAQRPADDHRSYGYERFQVLAAFVNGVTLLALSLWIVVEAIQRMLAPPQVAGGLMLVIATFGLLVNAGMFWLLHHGDREDLNLRAAVLHVLGDLLGSGAAIVAALVILTTGWMPIDPLLSILVALLILRSAWRLTRESTHILLEGTPDHIRPADLSAAVVETIPGVQDVHHVHAWSLTGRGAMVTLHVRVDRGTDAESTLRAIHQTLSRRFGVHHATVQIEFGPCADTHLEAPTRPAS